MSEQTKGAKWTAEVYCEIHDDARRRWIEWNSRGAVTQNLTDADSYDYHVARAAWEHAMQGIGNPEAVREVIEAARETVWARMGGTAKDRDTAQIRLKKALAALEQETIP